MSHAQPIETQVWTPDGLTMTAILGDASSAQWTDLLGDVGSGSVDVSLYDPKLPFCLEGALVKFCLGGVPVFAFFNDSPKTTVAEASRSVLTMSGRSVLAYLNFALVYPPGGVGAPTGTTQTFTGTPGAMLNTLLTAAQARGTCPALTWDFTATADSTGTAWAANVNLTLDAKAMMLDVVKKLAALGLGVSMDPQLVLHVYNPGAQGADLTSTVIWRTGMHFTGPVDNAANRSAMATVALVEGAGGTWVERTDATYTADPYVGRREAPLDLSSTTGDAAQMNAAGDAQIALTETASQALSVSLNHGLTSAGLYEPYQDYRLGDTVALDVPGTYAAAPFQVVGLTIAQTDGANYAIDANLGSIALPLDLVLLRQAASVSGSGSSVPGSIAGNLTLGNPQGFPMGATLPANPSTGMVWFYTAAGWFGWVYYDGAAWAAVGRSSAAVAFNWRQSDDGNLTGTGDNVLHLLDAPGCTTTRMPWAGSVVGMAIRASSARTAGTLTAKVLIAGVAQAAPTCVLDGTNTTALTATVGPATTSFNATNTIAITLTTASWTPVADTIEVIVYVRFA
jgi:hypothetical protein